MPSSVAITLAVSARRRSCSTFMRSRRSGPPSTRYGTPMPPCQSVPPGSEETSRPVILLMIAPAAA
ncbi:MAG: hypothetical protein ACO3YY_00870 [Phycisphaerales bacterium]